MKPRIEAPRRMNLPHLTSSGVHVSHEVGVAPPPPAAGARLPERYGIPLLELLVVDTEYIFVSWELTPEQLAASRAALGEDAWLARRLMVRVLDAASAEITRHVELYGEAGRWFIHLDRCGFTVRLELGWQCGSRFEVLMTTGAVAIPRDYMIEPDVYDELYVQYGKGADGRLVLKRVSREPDAPWPQITLPQPEIIAEQEHDPRELPQGVQSWTLGSGIGQRKLIVTPSGRAALISSGVSSRAVNSRAMSNRVPGSLDLPSSTTGRGAVDLARQVAEGVITAPSSGAVHPPLTSGPGASATGLPTVDGGTYKAPASSGENDNIPPVFKQDNDVTPSTEESQTK